MGPAQNYKRWVFERPSAQLSECSMIQPPAAGTLERATCRRARLTSSCAVADPQMQARLSFVVAPRIQRNSRALGFSPITFALGSDRAQSGVVATYFRWRR